MRGRVQFDFRAAAGQHRPPLRGLKDNFANNLIQKRRA
jgi:hypothetical protein